MTTTDQGGGDLVPTTASLAPLRGSAIVTPAVQASQALEAQQAYQDLCRQLLDDTDVQRIGDKDFRKKSGWRKLAVAFNVSNEIVERDYERDDRGRIIRAEVIDRATAPNGRTCDGLGACDLFEKCCMKATCRIKAQWHDHCDDRQGGCDGTRHFSNPQHDIPATAATRARNRACADLFGMGEVSAEEITNPDRGDHHGAGRGRAGEEDDQRSWFEQNGWVDEEEHGRRKAALRETLTALPLEQQKAFGAKRREAKIELGKEANTLAEIETMESWVADLTNDEAPDATSGTEGDAKAPTAPPPGEPSQNAPAAAEAPDPATLEPEGGWSVEEITAWANAFDRGGVDAALAHAELEAGGRMPDKRIRLARHWVELLGAEDDPSGSTEGGD